MLIDHTCTCHASLLFTHQEMRETLVANFRLAWHFLAKKVGQLHCIFVGTSTENDKAYLIFVFTRGEQIVCRAVELDKLRFVSHSFQLVVFNDILFCMTACILYCTFSC